MRRSKADLHRILCAVMSMVMVLALCACGSSTTSKDSATNDSEGDAAVEPIIIKYGHGNGASEDDMNHNSALKFKELVETYSNGELQVDIYPASQLGDEAEMFGACGLGTQEICAGAVTNYVAYSPAMTVLTLPYIFDDIETCRAFFHEEIDWLNQYAIPQANSRFLGIACPAARQLTCKKEVHTLDDMKGMKVRVPSTQPMIDCYTAWGASPQVIAWGETYTALEQGVVEAQDNPIWTLIDNKFAEVQDYVVETSYIMQPNALVCSEDFFQSLTASQQEALTRAGREACVYFEELGDKMISEYQAKAEAEGVTFLGVPEDIDRWIEAARGVWKNSYETIGSGDVAAAEEIIQYFMDFNASH